MANNVLEHLAQMSTPDIKRSNWNLDYDNAGTNDFGFLKVKFCELINANSKVNLDFKSAYCTNPTISPVFSKAKVRVTAIWVPISLYVPALRDNVAVKPGETDYIFPNINFDYSAISGSIKRSLSNPININWDADPMVSVNDQNITDLLVGQFRDLLPYNPIGSIYSELGMWKPDFQPSGFTNSDSVEPNYPQCKSAIPFLGYYDFYRTYIANSQDNSIPIRKRSFKPSFNYTYTDELGNESVKTIDPIPAHDIYVARNDFDLFFRSVRQLGASYAIVGDSPLSAFDIGPLIKSYFGSLFPDISVINKQIYIDNESRETIKSFMSRNKPLAISDNHFNELRDTYRGDYFTAFLSNENVEYERSTARVQADDGGVITMEQIYSAQRVQNYVRRSVFKNNGYSDFVEAQTGITPPTNLSHPMFLGSVSSDIYWNDVVSQTQVGDGKNLEDNTTLGSRAALGFGRMMTGKYRKDDERSFVSFTAKEPGYLMLIESIVPDISYFQTYNVDFDKVSLEDLYWPAFDKDGYQDKHLTALVQQPDSPLGDKPFTIAHDFYNLAYAQEPAYFEYMAKYNKITGQLVEPGVYRHWVFSRQGYSDNSFDTGTQMLSIDEFIRRSTSVYVDPEPYNKIFANENGLDNFQTYYSFDFKVYQPLSHRFLSF